jgi:hypothetical protein
VPVDPARYDYRRAALDAMHFAKLVDRWVQNLRRGAGFKVQYFAAIGPQRRLAPHVHVAMRGAIERRVIRAVTTGTYFQLWWPSFDVPLYVHRSPVFIDGAYRDPDTHQALKTWEDALAELDQDPDTRPAHVMRLGAQVDVKGILAGSKDADRTIGYLTKYLAKSMSAPMGDHQESGSPAAAHHDRLAAQVRWLPCTGCATASSPRTPARDCAQGAARPRPTTPSTSGWTGAGCWSAGSGPARPWTCTAPTGPPSSATSWRRPGYRSPGRTGAPPTSWPPTGEPRFVWSELPPGEGSYNAAVFAQILQRHTWRAQYDTAKRITGRTGPPVDNRSATTAPTPHRLCLDTQATGTL